MGKKKNKTHRRVGGIMNRTDIRFADGGHFSKMEWLPLEKLEVK